VLTEWKCPKRTGIWTLMLLRGVCNEKREQRCADRQRSGTGGRHDR
jgi:hypothetical protein